MTDDRDLHKSASIAVWLAVLAMLVSIAAAATTLYLTRQMTVRQQQLTQQLGDLTGRLALAEQRNNNAEVTAKLTALEARMADFAAVTDRLVEQNNTLHDMAEKVSTLDATQQQMTSALDTLTTQDHATRLESWQRAIAEIEHKADGGLPFANELPALQNLAPPAARPLLDMLMPVAQDPPPGLQALTDDLTTTAARINAQDAMPEQNRGIGAQLMTYLRRFVTIRPLPSATADPRTVDGKISHALYSLQQNDLANAIAAVAEIPALAQWRAEAKTREQLDDILQKLAALTFDAPPVLPSIPAPGGAP